MGLLSGKDVAEALKVQMKADVEALKGKGVNPTLGIIRMGAEPGDLAYEKGAKKTCEELGVGVQVFELPREGAQGDLIATIKKVNADKAVHGVLLFQPLPKQIDAFAARAALDPAKDMDGITDGSMAGIYSDSGKGYPPCTAESVIKILKHYKVELAGKNVVVLGRSTVIGKPVSMLLLKENATVTVCHSKTKDLTKKTQEADVVVVAMGKAYFCDKSFFRAGQFVIDVGVNAKPSGEKGTCGDIKTEEVEPIVAGITPVPGGVGSVTNVNLITHVIDAAKKA
ncbi:MAG: bifunctional 5,10-methylene-tetrahydrofolate dehydrogenase/5,10-methylene-tetrahydrofolate cyclohydrolase [Spirochaetaceae bacterium]|jgi:methylenetetrahydrofolate dehydrogenase (NADP+)/methenyltetrahydrofolate cyclohydrolase|nr:bifunctional 5,10-methylene-tetrahydrofolate dehydrogenase/5,10-methylene-tetrahydrofolate cyclohydrolase [Spirochaetaceae bacterium]